MMCKIISVSLPEDLIKLIDEAAKANYESRSDFIRLASLNALSALQPFRNMQSSDPSNFGSSSSSDSSSSPDNSSSSGSSGSSVKHKFVDL